MEEQLISSKTADLAKEKGFVCKTNNHYDSGSLFISDDKFKKRQIRTNPSNWNGMGLNIASAPTQSILQRWLRDKHNIDVMINRCVVPDGVVRYSSSVYTSNDLDGISGLLLSSNYYDVLEDGLVTGLRLLERTHN